MKSQLTFLHWRVGFAALLMLASTQAENPPTARNLPQLMPAPEFVLQHESEIGLTSEQRSQLENALSEWNPATRKSEAQVRQESNALAQLLAVEKPNEVLVAAQFDKVLAAENEVKRVRLKLSLRTREVLTADQQQKLGALQNRESSRRVASPEQQELAEKMARLKELIEQAKARGRDLANVRTVWKRVDEATRERRIADACRILDEACAALSAAPTK